MLASYHGHAPLVKLLLQHGADPNVLNDRGQSPLAGAVFKGESGVIEVSLTDFSYLCLFFSFLCHFRVNGIHFVSTCWTHIGIGTP